MLNTLTQYQITFITPCKRDNGILKPKFRQTYSCIPIRITIPRHSSATFPPNPRVLVTGFIAKVHFGAGCQCESAIFDTLGLSTAVDAEGFREIRGGDMSKWIGFKDEEKEKEKNWPGRRGMGMPMKASTSKTGIIEVRNMVFNVPGIYKIAFELQFDSGQPLGSTPWQTVEVQRVRKHDHHYQQHNRRRVYVSRSDEVFRRARLQDIEF